MTNCVESNVLLWNCSFSCITRDPLVANKYGTISSALLKNTNKIIETCQQILLQDNAKIVKDSLCIKYFANLDRLAHLLYLNQIEKVSGKLNQIIYINLKQYKTDIISFQPFNLIGDNYFFIIYKVCMTLFQTEYRKYIFMKESPMH